MLKRLSVVSLALVLSVSTLYASKGKIRVASDQQGAYVYVDGKKKAMTGEGFTSILLEEGEYTIKVAKDIDGNYVYIQSKRVFVGEDTSTKLSFKLKRKITDRGEVAQKAKRTRWRRSGSTVTDAKLNLEWQDNSKAKTNERKWSSAKRYCRNLTLSGHSDWRLPSYDELLTIVDYDRYDPAIMPSFQNVASSGYWSASQVVSGAEYAWFVNFEDGGNANYGSKSYVLYVRCVRHRQ